MKGFEAFVRIMALGTFILGIVLHHRKDPDATYFVTLACYLLLTAMSISHAKKG